MILYTHTHTHGELLEETKLNKKHRNSNFELLRILAMIMIILHHFSIYNNINNIKDLSFNSYIGIYFFALGKLGVNLFVLITGYFLVNSKLKLKKIFKLWLQVLFYSIGILIVLKCFKVVDIKFDQIYSYFLPVLSRKYWFISVYIFLYILSPFINKFIHCINKKEYTMLIIILTTILSIIYSVFYKFNVYQTEGTIAELFWFIYLYLLSGYIRLYGIKFLNNKKLNILITILVLTVFIFFLLLSHIININFDKMENVIYHYTRQNSIFILLLSVLIFYIFKNMKIRQSKIINFLGSITLGVYLLHEHPLIRKPLWYTCQKVMSAYNINIIIMPIICVVFLFAIASIIEKLRIIIVENKILKINKLNNLFDKIDNKINT